MKSIKLMTDYSSYPIWWHGTNIIDDEVLAGSINPKDLPLSENTVYRLMRWQEKWDAILNQEDPSQSGFATPEEEQSFEREGFYLWYIVQEELKDKYHVAYFSVEYQRVFENPEYLENKAKKI